MTFSSLLSPLLSLVPLQTFLLCSFVLFVVWFYYRCIALPWPNAPPTPFRLPLLGNLMQFTIQPQLTLPGLVERYGAIFTIYAGKDNPMVLINSSSLVDQVFRGARAADRPATGRSLYFDIITKNGNDLAWEKYSPRVTAMRKLIASSILSQHGFQRWNVNGTIEQSMNLLIQSWNQAIDESDRIEEGVSLPSSFALISPLDYLKSFSMSVIMLIVFGKFYSYHDHKFQELCKRIEYLMQVVGAGNIRDAIYELRYLPSSEQKKVQYENNLLQAFIRNEIDQHIEQRKQMKLQENYDQNARDFIDEILIIKESEEFKSKDGDDWLSRDRFTCLLQDLLVAGTDTTAVSLTWACLWAANYPEAQAKCREEIDRVIGNRRVSTEDMSNLVYTKAYLDETMRLWPVGPLGVPHASAADMTINDNGKDYSIPKGTILCLNTLCIHRERSTWGSDAHQFRPERFLDPAITPEFLKTNFVPFGFGMRKCPGIALAERELLLLWVTLMQNFYIFRPTEALIPENSIWGLALAPAPFQIKIVKRQKE
jgi:cytochrome P450